MRGNVPACLSGEFTTGVLLDGLHERRVFERFCFIDLLYDLDQFLAPFLLDHTAYDYDLQATSGHVPLGSLVDRPEVPEDGANSLVGNDLRVDDVLVLVPTTLSQQRLQDASM